jgi:hypothetical protein
MHAPHGSSDRDGTQGGAKQIDLPNSWQLALPQQSVQFMQLCRRDTLMTQYAQDAAQTDKPWQR